MGDPEDFLRRLFDRKAAELGLSAAAPSTSVLRRVRRRQVAAAFTAVAVVAGIAVASFAGVRALTDATPRPIIQPTRANTPNRLGGSITLGTRELFEGVCLNPITSCAAATGVWWIVLEQVLPRAMELDAKGSFVPSPLLVEAPSLENGGLTENPFTVTYQLNPEANWADGTPITSADFDFTWRATMNTTGAYSTAGFDQITAIDTKDPKTAVITFKSLFADWADLFGGAYGGLLEEAAFPQYLNDPTPDLANEMHMDVPFSGGPWMLASFTGEKAVLVRNDHYYGKVPLLDQATIVSVTDTIGAVHLLTDGTIDAIPWPADQGFLDGLSDDPNIDVAAGGGSYFEALWFNHEAAPLDDAKVREALMYAIDRQAVIDQVVRPLNPNAEVLNCGFLAVPNMGPWCDTTPFAQFTYDPDKAKQILESDGYECSNVPCTKAGQKLTVDYSTVSTNERRLQAQQLLRDQALPAGFEFHVRNAEAGTLFGDRGPRGDFGMADYASGGSADPSVTSSLACERIPTKANDFVGGNWNRWCDRDATDLMHRSDRELDQNQRLALMDQIYAIQAQDFLSLPLYVLPDLAAWRTDRLAGPVGTYNGTLYGLFFNMNEWSEIQP
jgi:peptide/nickel transport system substrate-binding protein